jgi:hypothetical protein
VKESSAHVLEDPLVHPLYDASIILALHLLLSLELRRVEVLGSWLFELVLAQEHLVIGVLLHFDWHIKLELSQLLQV